MTFLLVAEKVNALETWQKPLDVKELQNFLGLATFNRRFISRVSIIAEPRYRRCRKGMADQWQQEQSAEKAPGQCSDGAYPDFYPGVGRSYLRPMLANTCEPEMS